MAGQSGAGRACQRMLSSQWCAYLGCIVRGRLLTAKHHACSSAGRQGFAGSSCSKPASSGRSYDALEDKKTKNRTLHTDI